MFLQKSLLSLFDQQKVEIVVPRGSIVSAVEKGRAIYSGIQKFVAFIMSVHIAEVMQIFVCIVAGVPVMRTPLQILFLILVTDLPPSIALGMEPGEPGILKLRLDTFLGAGTH